jgi:hypothetical protein
MHLEVMRSPSNVRRLKLCAALVSLGVLVGFSVTGRADDRQAPECLQSNKTVIYRAFGYDHIVELRNTCPSAVRCELSTAADPAQSVALEPGEDKHLLLRRGSPAREFDYRLVCHGGT